MNIMPVLDCEQNDLKIDKIVVTFGREAITLQYIIDWNINYSKLSSSSFSMTFYGTSQKLVEMLTNRKHVTGIKLVGRAEWIDYKPGTVAQSFVWNINCDMYIDELNTEGEFGEVTKTELLLVGEMR